MSSTYKHLALAMICLAVAACGGPKVKSQNTAEKYFLEGERFFESNLYIDAIASWEKVRDTFYSPELSMLAELKIAETYFITQRYEEAATAYSDFHQQHPNDFRAATVLYRLGLSYYHQILSADRDQSNTENALRTFQTLVRRFPDDQNAREAGYLIERCKTRLAEHEVYVGRYYLKMKHYRPAIKRLEALLESYPDFYYRDEAFFYLGKAYFKTQQPEKAQQIFQQLFEQFPGSDFVEDARELIEENS